MNYIIYNIKDKERKDKWPREQYLEQLQLE